MTKRPTVHFSNRLEELAEQLGCQLFQEGADPFAKRIVLLPSHSLKLYLTSFFASHPEWNICAGITFKTLLNGAFACFSDEEKKNFPSPLALSFLVEQEILQSNLPEVQEYLEPKTAQKQVWLAEELSRLFYRYSTEEAEALQDWKQKKGWKQTLWQKVFSESKCFSEELLKQEGSDSQEIHLFGFSYIPKHLYEFFSKKGMHVYFVSPSPFFWEDLCSDQERIFLEKKMDGKKVHLQVKEQMSLFLRERHPLLANWGKAGRPLLRQLGDTEAYLEEEYIDPLLEGDSTLNYLQSGLFDLEETQKELSPKDTSFLCLSAPSKLREIEALYETLQELMLEHQDIEPKDILVLSPNLEAYFPYIQMVFGSKVSQIGYSVHGLSLSLAEENSQALTFFFSLAEGRFDRASLIQFFSFPSVMKKFGWEREDIHLLEEWFEKARVLWGFDPEHKELAINQSWPSDAFAGSLPQGGTWEEGIERLVKGLAIDLDFFPQDEVITPWPLPIVEWSDSELLGEFIQTLTSLQEDVKPIYQREEKTLDEWIFLAQKWILTYFEKTSVEESLVRDLESLKKELTDKVSNNFPFTSFKRVIETHFHQKKESFQSAQLNTVKFLSMQLGASFPSKVICAIGCDEGSFPRTKEPSSFAEKSGKGKGPSITEQDRYLFLEMILHARRAFICSYQKMSWKDQKEQGPSLLIQDVMNELDTHFVFSDSNLKPSAVFTRHHPAISFDQRYFQETGFHSFSPHLFHQAEKYYAQEKSKAPPFSLRVPEKTKETSLVIDIKELQAFAKDPIRLYCKETLGIFFDFVSPKEEEFFFSPLTASQVKKETLKQGFDTAIARAEAKGLLPLGRIGELAVQDLEESVGKWQEHLQSFGLTQDQIFSLEFSQDAKVMEKKEGTLILPPLSIESEEGRSILIVGKIDLVSSQGFLWTGGKSSAARPIELFPTHLIIACLPKSLGIEPKALLLETGKTMSVPLQDPLEQLSLYVKLYQKACSELCPIRPDWSMDFLTKTKEEVEKKRSASLNFKKFFDPYEEWMSKRGAFPEMDEIYEVWHAKWKEVFSPLIDKEIL